MSKKDKVLVIPDCHLKPWMFTRASEILRAGTAARAVCLMDLPDDWNRAYDLELYRETFNAAKDFAVSFPETLWCYGNHDLSYVWGAQESGYSPHMAYEVRDGLKALKEALPSDDAIAYVHRIGDCVFCHGGLHDYFVSDCMDEEKYNDIDAVITKINGFSEKEMWCDSSPIWFRPQMGGRPYNVGGILQVVGHTPVTKIEKHGNVLSCDTFSTYRNGVPIGTQEFAIVDTITQRYVGIR